MNKRRPPVNFSFAVS